MNKKRLIYLGLFIVIVIVVWLLISFWGYNKKGNLNNSNQSDFSNMTARETANWDEPFLKEVKLEFMTDEDRTKMNVTKNPSLRLQVLERDAAGNVTAYKKIYSDEDIIRYKVDYSGGGNITNQVATTSATSTEVK